LDHSGLALRISDAAVFIDRGRKGFATRGKEAEGRISYEKGIALAMSAFKEALLSADPYTIILAEYSLLIQELQLCDKNDIDSISSLFQALQSFEDAFLAIKAVEGSSYQVVDFAIPHCKKYRFKDYPKDAFHIACDSHKTRLKNILRFPGIDPIEKDLLKQRLANLPAAMNGYVEKQKKALNN